MERERADHVVTGKEVVKTAKLSRRREKLLRLILRGQTTAGNWNIPAEIHTQTPEREPKTVYTPTPKRNRERESKALL